MPFSYIIYWLVGVLQLTCHISLLWMFKLGFKFDVFSCYKLGRLLVIVTYYFACSYGINYIYGNIRKTKGVSRKQV